MEETRNKIKEIEAAITAITGCSLIRNSHWAEDKMQRTKVADLLKERCLLLNSMFSPTPENMERFLRINNHLYTMTNSLEKRIAGINAQADYIADEWDDDEEVEGWLRVVYDDGTSVLSLDDDAVYGSDFPLMIKVLTELYEAQGLSDVEYICRGMSSPDNDMDWHDIPFLDKSEFDNVIISHAVFNLTNQKSYSIPDLIRLNDFWCEAMIRFQSITQQDGSRWNKYAQ